MKLIIETETDIFSSAMLHVIIELNFMKKQ